MGAALCPLQGTRFRDCRRFPSDCWSHEGATWLPPASASKEPHTLFPGWAVCCASLSLRQISSVLTGGN